jgi:hypothetical protein
MMIVVHHFSHSRAVGADDRALPGLLYAPILLVIGHTVDVPAQQRPELQTSPNLEISDSPQTAHFLRPDVPT